MGHKQATAAGELAYMFRPGASTVSLTDALMATMDIRAQQPDPTETENERSTELSAA